MAIYIPASRRRRRLLLFMAAALVAGAILGVVGGRATAPSIEARVRSTEEQARVLAAGLRVLELHQEVGATSTTGGPDATVELALKRTETDLRRVLDRAPWVPAATGADLLGAVTGLERTVIESSTPEFARRTEAAAIAIEAAFGLRNRA